MVLLNVSDSLLNRLIDVIIPRPIVDFLNTIILDKSWIWLNYWSFVHLFAGIGFYFLFPTKLWTWVIINLVFELVEYILAFGGHPLFVEEFVDIVWDLFWSIGGFLLVREIVGKFENGKLYIPKVPIIFRFHPKLKCLDDENFVIG